MSRKQKRRSDKRGAPHHYGRTNERPASAAGKKHRRRRGNNVLWYLLILAFMVTTTIILTTTVFFKIKTITVTGSEHYDDRSLIISSGILLEENMFRLKDGQIKEKLIEEYSYIAAVKIRRRLPDTIILEITEADPAGAIDAGAGYTLISGEGRVLECNTPVLPEEMPVVMGFSEETPAQGSYLDETDSENVKRMRLVMDAVEKTGFLYFNIIDLSDPYNLKLYYQDIFEIVLGTDTNLEYKLELVTEVIEAQDLVASFHGIIDASYDGEVWTRPSGSVTPPSSTGQGGGDSQTDAPISESAPGEGQQQDSGSSIPES
ncbi:MAG: FtsQ-type POTRA domain-containing protein [Oscillospiraceae bacterium]|nr:FtsQ-type POTRA domain-containing protein [Oscillospiraceae bacterium]